jgi:hypothetical protein
VIGREELAAAGHRALHAQCHELPKRCLVYLLAHDVADAILPLIAEHDAEVAAKTLREAADRYGEGVWLDTFMANQVDDDVSAVQAMCGWLNAEADRIEASHEC